MANRRIQGAELFVTALLIMVVIGVVVNNLTNSGMISPSTSQTCSTDPGEPICTLNTAVGCSVNPAYCQLSGSSISVLNRASPFTPLFSLNILGFWSSVFGRNMQATIYSEQPQFPFTNSTFQIDYTPYTSGPVNQGIAYCNPYGTTGGTFNTGAGVIHPVSVYGYTCLYAGYPYYGFLTHGWWGTYCRGGGPPSTQLCAFVDAINDPLNGHPGDSTRWLTNDTAYIMGINGAVGPYCPRLQSSTTGYEIVQLTEMYPYPYNSTYSNVFNVNYLGCTETSNSGSASNPFNFIAIMGFLVGAAILIIIALGIGFDAGALTVNWGIRSNSQGTKLAQVIGLGLVIWIPLYSEFSGWFTSGYLPYGLDGATGIVSVALTAMGFLGLYLMIVQPVQSG